MRDYTLAQQYALVGLNGLEVFTWTWRKVL